MSTPPVQDDDFRLKGVIDQVSDAEGKNASAFDKAILTLSSGALALSFVFIKDIVRRDVAKFNMLLFWSWAFFILALALNVLGFMYALHCFRSERRMIFAALRYRSEPESALQPLMERHREALYRFNVTQGVCFLLGVLTFTGYVMINF